jgi:hypothetical protein
MSSYRFLQDAYIGGLYFPAGSTAATADAGGLLPTAWIPGPFVDPLDTPAVNAFYAAGPQRAAKQWGGTNGAPGPKPATYWLASPQGANPSVMLWSLTGLGIGKAAIFTGNGVGAQL